MHRLVRTHAWCSFHHRALSSSARRPSVTTAPDGKPWDVAVVGGGHNGLVAAAYLAKAGRSVVVLERRHLVGGAAVTEEIVPGFKFSRASYVYSLFRPEIVRDLDLKRHGLHVYPRSPSSFTPTSDGRYLLLGGDAQATVEQIAKFSPKDAKAYPIYNEMLERMAKSIEPLLDVAPPDLAGLLDGTRSLPQRARLARDALPFARAMLSLGRDAPAFLELVTAPARQVLERWFESDVLVATLATDAVIGAMVSPSTPGSGYVLFHHVMGEVDGAKGVWGYVRGGMGALSQAVASAAMEAGARIETNAPVSRIYMDETCSTPRAAGVELDDGTLVQAKAVFCNANPRDLFLNLLPKDSIPEETRSHMQHFSTTPASTKINIAVDRLPVFPCIRPAAPGAAAHTPGPEHQGTIHFEDNISLIEAAYTDAQQGRMSQRPLVEMVVPSAVDPTLAPDGKHVCLLFVQYTPYELKEGSWTDPATRAEFLRRVLAVVDEFSPGFSSSVVGVDMLTPPDLERVFGLPQGNIFHGGMSLNQMLWNRPAPGCARYQTPVPNVFLCGAGAHPGGGVMGAPGRNAAQVYLQK